MGAAVAAVILMPADALAASPLWVGEAVLVVGASALAFASLDPRAIRDRWESVDSAIALLTVVAVASYVVSYGGRVYDEVPLGILALALLYGVIRSHAPDVGRTALAYGVAAATLRAIAHAVAFLAPTTGHGLASDEVFAVLMAISAPAASALAVTSRSSHAQNLFSAVAPFLFLSGVSTGSRTAVVAGAVGCVSAMLLAKGFSTWFPPVRRARALAVGGALAAVVLSVAALYHLRPESVHARAVASFIAVESVEGRWLMGGGAGGYEHNYMVAQAAHFSDPMAITRDRMIVGYRDHADNEWVQVLAELGVVGVGLALIIALALLRVAFRVSNEQRSPGVVCAGAILVAASLAALTTSPLRTVPTAVVLVLAVGLLMARSGSTDRSSSLLAKRLTPPRWLVRALSLVMILGATRTALANADARRALDLAAAGRLDDAIAYQTRAAPVLLNNPRFLVTFGGTLFADAEYRRAQIVLERAVTQGGDPKGHLLLGRIHQGIGNLEASHRHYLVASQMMPHWIEPQYRIVHLLFENGETLRARHLAHQALGLEVKVPSPATQMMRHSLASVAGDPL